MTSVADILNIERPCDIDVQGLQCDLLWSDPSTHCCLFGRSLRGAGYMFGKEAVDLFCEANDIQLIVRAHEIVEDGYEFNFNKKVLTIFSAPNYCHKFTNDAGILKVNENLECSIVRLSVNTKNRELSVKSRGRESSLVFRDDLSKISVSQPIFWNLMETTNNRKSKRIEKKKIDRVRSRSLDPFRCVS
jgi:hypothetical protein